MAGTGWVTGVSFPGVHMRVWDVCVCVNIHNLSNNCQVSSQAMTPIYRHTRNTLLYMQEFGGDLKKKLVSFGP